MPRIHADRRQDPIVPEPIAPDSTGRAVQRKTDYASQSAALSPFAPDRDGRAVQRKADYASESAALSPFSAAERGTSGSGGKLPHLDAIQQSFGKYDVSDVSFHAGPEAVSANRDLGSQAFAYGNSVAAGRSLDLATAAHEAAHVVQQRGGNAPADGIGRSGDPYEAHADQVAEAVVAGESAEPILDAMTGGSSAACGGSTAVQQKSIQAFMGGLGGLGDLASAALDAFTSDGDKDSGGATKKSGKSGKSDEEQDTKEGSGTILGGIGTLIGTALKAASQAPAETEAPAAKSGVYDSKGRKLPGFWNQETQLNGLVKILKRLEPFADPEWEVTKSETPDKGMETPTHYKFTVLPGATWDPPFEGEYYDLLKHLQNRITSNPEFKPSAVWMPSWAPKKAKDYVDNKEYAAGKRSAIYIKEGTGLLLWVDDSGATTKFEMMALMPADRKVYEDKAKAAGLDPEGRYGADFLKEMAMINNQDYQDLVLCNLLSPTQARKYLVGVGKDVALIMAAGVMNLYSPQATFAQAPGKALMDAVGSYAGYHAAKQDNGGFDAMKDREKKPTVPEAPGGYYKGGVCSE